VDEREPGVCNGDRRFVAFLEDIMTTRSLLPLSGYDIYQKALKYLGEEAKRRGDI
jgi:hypothetical protein